MKSKKLSEQIIKTFKSNGFVLSEPDVLLDSEYIIQRSGENFKKSMQEYIKIQNILRGSGISTEIYPGENKLKKQMEYANKINSPAVILYGENEIKLRKPTVRNLNSGNEKSIEIKELVNEIKKII